MILPVDFKGHLQMGSALQLPPADGQPDDLLLPRLTGVIESAHGLWAALSERRRLRAFGFRPAVEPGVLKRDWRDLSVRVSITGILARRADGTVLTFRASNRSLSVNGQALTATRADLDLVSELLDLVHEYERWVEAREGRDERLRRSASVDRDRRPVNTLAETRRLQRMLHLVNRRSRH